MISRKSTPKPGTYQHYVIFGQKESCKKVPVMCLLGRKGVSDGYKITKCPGSVFHVVERLPISALSINITWNVYMVGNAYLADVPV